MFPERKKERGNHCNIINQTQDYFELLWFLIKAVLILAVIAIRPARFYF